MPVTPENLPKHELIGLNTELVQHPDETKKGIKGEVLDETQKTLRIGELIVEKQESIFLFTLPSGEKVRLDGELIAKRPEERIKMKLPNKWSL